MTKNLFDFAGEDIKRADNQSVDEEKVKEKIGENTFAEASKLYDKYKNYSTEELTDEFVSLSKKRLKDGSLTKEKLSRTLSSIYSFLSPSQKDFFDKLMGEIDE